MRHRATLTLAVVLAMLAALAVLVPAAPAQARPAEDRLERLARAKINALRAQNGVRPLRISRGLTRSAASYARYMMRSGYFGHRSTIHAPRRYRSLGEIILLHRGLHPKPRVAVKNWARSSGHRYVMLSPKFGSVGVGKASGHFQGHRVTLWVSHVGRK